VTTPHPLRGRPDALEVAVPVATMWTGPDAAREADAAAVLAEPDVEGWTAGMDQESRRGLMGRTLTQLLLGEGVEVLEERGPWVRVAALLQPSSQDPSGYPGWVRRVHLGSPVPRSEGATAFVMGRTATCRTSTGSDLVLSFGTALWVDEVRDGSVEVLLPGGDRGSLPRQGVRLAQPEQSWRFGPEDALGLAEQFLGLRYLWGGTSSWGLDCSGLVHLTHRALGVLVPRDAADQAEAANVVPVPLDDVRRGDLYFFARPGEGVYHVGFASRAYSGTGERFMLHAPEAGQRIEDAVMAPHRADALVSAGRVTP
jgi:gamma-D-glutamyl-L-lysine dipeptidyl-peptidase